ncbi:MAG: NAD-dependent epimerase/dehydratase family protein [Candidatus Omnitrophica bacterium]|nr:NAD-dependent epimerase/dehydratase family protein [Candidatus Omnitrophota bacterium]
MRVLVTGGAGLVGSHAAEYYARQKADVIAFDNLIRPKLFGSTKKCVGYNWDYLKQYENINRVIGDIRDEEDVAKVVKGVDVVIHAAAQPGVPSSSRIPREDFAINAYGTLNVLEALRKHSPGATFIYCSTNKVYGENVDRYGLEENASQYRYKDISDIDEAVPIDHTGHTPYGASKYVGDLYTQEYARVYGMRTAVFRMSCIYGTRQFGFEDQGWVAWFVVASLLKKPITIYGDGKQVRDLLYVEDLIYAFDAFIKSDLKHAVFNIGGGPNNCISLLDFLKFLDKELNSTTKVNFSNWRPLDQKVYISNIDKLKEKLNWQPEIPIQEGTRRLIKWTEQNKLLF